MRLQTGHPSPLARTWSARRLVTGVCVIAAATFLAAGCGGGDGDAVQTGASEEPTGAPLVVNIGTAPATIDPSVACLSSEVTFTNNFYARLTQYGSKSGPDGTTQIDWSTVEPWLAESWTISDDGLVYTFKLRQGLKFPSGNPVDAEAVKYSFDRVLTMNQCGAYFILDGLYEPPLIKSVEAPDPATVVITLNQPDANALQLWSTPAAGVVDQSVIEANGGITEGEINEYMASHVAGYGPFLLESYEPNKRAVLVANPNFFEPPASERITVNFVNSDPTLLLQARSGEADVTLGLSKQSVHSLEGNDCCRIIANDSVNSEKLVMRHGKPPLDNVKFREALTYAIPYEEILENVAFGYGTLYYGPWAPSFPWFNAEIEQPRTFDLERAAALIQESGVTTPVKFSIIVPEGNAVEEQIATIVQGTWRELGVNLTVRKLSAADYFGTLDDHKHDLAMYLDGPAVLAPDYLWDYDAKCDVLFDYTETCIPDADKLIAQLRSTTDPAERQQLTDEAARLWIANSPRADVYADKFVAVLGKDMKQYHYAHLTDFRTWGK